MYGRSMMKGYLNSKGINVAEHRIASSLECVSPESHERRRHNIVDKTNPIPLRLIILVIKFTLTKMKNWLCMGSPM